MSRQQQVDRQVLRIALPAIGENFLQMLMGMRSEERRVGKECRL